MPTANYEPEMRVDKLANRVERLKKMLEHGRKLIESHRELCKDMGEYDEMNLCDDFMQQIDEELQK